MKDYLVILERGESSWGASCPDVPGCIAVADTREETLRMFQEALQFHLEGLHEDGDPIPEPSSEAATVSVHMPLPIAA